MIGKDVGRGYRDMCRDINILYVLSLESQKNEERLAVGKMVTCE